MYGGLVKRKSTIDFFFLSKVSKVDSVPTVVVSVVGVVSVFSEDTVVETISAVDCVEMLVVGMSVVSNSTSLLVVELAVSETLGVV